MLPLQFLANLDRNRELLTQIVAGLARTILVARSTRLRLPPRPKLNEAPGGLQFFPQVAKQSFSTE